MRVLLVEDEPKLGAVLTKGLREAGLVVDLAGRGEDALWMTTPSRYDAIVLDLVLPGIDGLETCRRLRDGGLETPILILTARDAVDYRIAALDTGADDYLTKPFDFGELAARLRALVRRRPANRATVLTIDDLALDPATRRVRRAGTDIPLTAKEFELLEVFMRHPGELLTRDRLLETAWDGTRPNGSNLIEVYIRYLREKIDRPFGRSTIQTVRGVGYRLVAGEPQRVANSG